MNQSPPKNSSPKERPSTSIYGISIHSDDGIHNHGFESHDESPQKSDGGLEEEFDGGREEVPEIVVHKCSTESARNEGALVVKIGKECDGGNHNSRGNALFWPQPSSTGGLLKTTNGNEGKISGRMRSMKHIDEMMSERDSFGTLFPLPQIGMAQCTSKASEPAIMFGMPKFHLDTMAVQRRILKKGKKPTIFQHLARFHNKFGIRHFVMIALLALYSIFGGLMFEAIERENEIHNVHKTSKILELSISRLAYKINGTLDVRATVEQHGQLILLIKQYYLEMLKIEGKYIGSVFHKYETLDLKKVLSWHFGSSVFYAMTLFTTIGYGTIACQTPLGKIVSIFYALFGIPLMLVVLTDLGQLMLRFFTFTYKGTCEICRNWLRLLALHILDIDRAEVGEFKSESKRKTSEGSELTSEEEEETIVGGFPLFLSVPIVLLYLLLASLLVSNFDWDENGPNGLTFGDAFYFSFVSLSTIGLGDVMPNSLQYSPLLAIFFLFGLALLSVVNSTLYMRVQNLFLAFVDHLEEYLERVHYYGNGHHEGYFVFKSLSSNIQLLALALPIFPDDQEDWIEAMFETRNTELSRQLFASPPQRKLGRAQSIGAADTFRPTLGILNTAPPSRRGTLAGQDWRRTGILGKSEETLGRRRAVTISCLAANPMKAPPELSAKALRWVDQKEGKRENEGSGKVRRIYTRRGERPSEGQFNLRRSLRRVQSERIVSSPVGALSVINELGRIGGRPWEDRRGARRRHIFESPSPRQMRRLMRRGGGEIERKTSGGKGE